MMLGKRNAVSRVGVYIPGACLLSEGDVISIHTGMQIQPLAYLIGYLASFSGQYVSNQVRRALFYEALAIFVASLVT